MILKKDFEAKLVLTFSSVIEEENKIYSEEKSEMNIVYLFKDNAEFEEYFIKNGVSDVNKDLLELFRVM